MCIFKRIQYSCGCEANANKALKVGGDCHKYVSGVRCFQRILEPPIVLNYAYYNHRMLQSAGAEYEMRLLIKAKMSY